jgi:hypothetical protein
VPALSDQNDSIDRYRELLALEPVLTANAALCQHYLRICRPSKQLARVCDIVDDAYQVTAQRPLPCLLQHLGASRACPKQRIPGLPVDCAHRCCRTRQPPAVHRPTLAPGAPRASKQSHVSLPLPFPLSYNSPD